MLYLEKGSSGSFEAGGLGLDSTEEGEGELDTFSFKVEEGDEFNEPLEVFEVGGPPVFFGGGGGCLAGPAFVVVAWPFDEDGPFPEGELAAEKLEEPLGIPISIFRIDSSKSIT